MKQHAPNDRILVIDDQEDNLRLVGTMLAQAGYEVIPATCAEQVFKRLEATAPDLVLLDLLMPGSDGLEVCRQLKEDPRWADLPVIFLSAADDKNLVVQALESGGVDYVTKPFNKAELLSRVRTHLALKKARDALRNLAEDKDELLGILAHDLKNHLAGMKLSAGLLADSAAALPPRGVSLVETIASSTDRMLAFVKEFLANQSAEHLVLNFTAVDLRELVLAIAARHQPAAAVKGVVLKTELGDEHPRVHADTEALGQVLDNLVSNAIKFSPPGRTVVISLLPVAGGRAACAIRDEGPGFTPEDQEKMFRRYGRLSARPTGGEPSTGLGLSIVKRLVDTLHGRLALDSRPGEGACFTLSLPVAE